MIQTMDDRERVDGLTFRGVIRCHECGAYALAEDRFCACCGTRLADHVRQEPDDAVDNFCSRCGHRMRGEE
jgi:ribosomal protein L32